MTGTEVGCPHCSFVMIDRGTLMHTVDITDNSYTVKVTRHAWELDMIEHWRNEHPEHLVAIGIAIDISRDALEAEFQRQVAETVRRVFTTRRY